MSLTFLSKTLIFLLELVELVSVNVTDEDWLDSCWKFIPLHSNTSRGKAQLSTAHRRDRWRLQVLEPRRYRFIVNIMNSKIEQANSLNEKQQEIPHQTIKYITFYFLLLFRYYYLWH